MIGLIIFIIILLMAWYGYWATLGMIFVGSLVLGAVTGAAGFESGGEGFAPAVQRNVINAVYQATPNAVGVDMYLYRRQYVLLVNVGCCDFNAMAYDIYGKRLGAPFGGISGKGDGTMSDWFPNAKFVQHMFGRTA